MYSCTGEQGCCSGESTYLPPLWPGFESSVNAIQCTGVKVVVGSFHFSPLLQAKNSKIKFQFDLEHMRSNWNLISELLVWRRGEKWKEPTTTSTPIHCMALTLDSNPGHSGVNKLNFYKLCEGRSSQLYMQSHIILHSAVHIYDFHIFKTSSSSFHRFITNQFNVLLPVGLLA